MSFLPHLEAVVTSVEGALACSVMGLDGIEVETFRKDGAEKLDLGAVWVEYANVLSQQVRNPSIPAGGVVELSINAEKVTNILRMVTPEYFLVLALRPEGNYGRGRYALRIAAPKVKAEL